MLVHVTNFPNEAALTDTQLRATLVSVGDMHVLVPTEYDYISLGYTGVDLTSVIYKVGGAGGVTVATLTLAYTLGILQSVVRT